LIVALLLKKKGAYFLFYNEGQRAFFYSSFFLQDGQNRMSIVLAKEMSLLHVKKTTLDNESTIVMRHLFSLFDARHSD
jgi:hypothetical protein